MMQRSNKSLRLDLGQREAESKGEEVGWEQMLIQTAPGQGAGGQPGGEDFGFSFLHSS